MSSVSKADGINYAPLQNSTTTNTQGLSAPVDQLLDAIEQGRRAKTMVVPQHDARPVVGDYEYFNDATYHPSSGVGCGEGCVCTALAINGLLGVDNLMGGLIVKNELAIPSIIIGSLTLAGVCFYIKNSDSYHPCRSCGIVASLASGAFSIITGIWALAS